MMTDPQPADLDDARPTVRHVLEAIQAEESLSHRELVQRTGYHPRTIRRTTKDLEERGLITRQPLPDDLRSFLYLSKED